jgi:hypothetical protein
MKKLLLTAVAGLAIVAAGSLTAPRASAMPLGLPVGTADQTGMIERVALCFYIDGWNGPGMYECGFRHRHGKGWHGRREGHRDGMMKDGKKKH